MQLTEVMPGQRLLGAMEQPIEVISTAWVGSDYLTIVYRDVIGSVGELLLDRSQEHQLRVHTGDDATLLPADGDQWKLATEALRLRFAALLDPMLAVSHSTLQPLPHQIKAVYGEFLPRTPLRYLLADDPGAGKTIMCGLYVKEMILRGDLDRCLIVAPGGLVDQWHDELWTRFGLQFRILSRDLMASTPSSSVFEEFPLLIARMDMLSRNEQLQEQLSLSEWDLIVVDEAHRMSARYLYRGELETTKRYNLGRLLGQLTRNLLLMTATPHSGDPSAFQAFLALLDEDRFGGQAQSASGMKPPGADIMRRMLKEELLTMEGKPLFPERRATTVSYELSPPEERLYEAVSNYVRMEMNRAKRLQHEGEGRRASTVGFALTVLQRRLASSPEAILRSLERRRSRLQRLSDELERLEQQSIRLAVEASDLALPADLDDWADSDAAGEEATEETLVDAASAARTRLELEVEIQALDQLVPLAVDVRARTTDSKWTELRSILEEHELTRDSAGRPRKMIIFSEHRDTLRYLSERIRALPGRAHGVVEIHGGLSRNDRLSVQRRFTEEPEVSVLVATDAAGEGLNLQCAHLMVNYDLPWNPNRIEQRFGRIHRIGQTEVCHLWNLVADGTREGDVFLRLLNKMAEQARAYEGKVFDVLGEAFEGTPLRELLVQAILHGDDPQVRAQVHTVIDEKIGAGIPELVRRRAMYQQVLRQVDVQEAQEKADLGARTKLQPYFVSSWFESSFRGVGGRVRRRSDGLIDITSVPEAVVAAARRSDGPSIRSRYELITFDPARAQANGGAGSQVLGPGHPLIESVTDVVETKSQEVLRAGTVLVDPFDAGRRPRLFCAVAHEVTNGHTDPRTISRDVAFVEIDESGQGTRVGPSYLDYRPATDQERQALTMRLDESPFAVRPDHSALEWAMTELVPGHVAHVRATHTTAIDRARVDVSERINAELHHWRRQRDGHVKSKQSPEQIVKRISRLESRLSHRLAELDGEARVVPRPPRVLSYALVVPMGMVAADETTVGRTDLRVAEDCVMAAERALGRTCTPIQGRRGAALRSKLEGGLSVWIDIRAYDEDLRQISFGRNEVLQALNLGDRHRLALVHADTHEVRYVGRAFARQRVEDFHQHQFDLSAGVLWRAAVAPY